MEKNMLCPKCGSENTEHIQSDTPRGKASGYRIDFEVHPFLCRCLDCGEVFPIPSQPDER